MGEGFFPLDEKWGLTNSVYSPERAKQMVWLSGLLPYEQAAEVFERIGRCHAPAASIWRQTRQYGERLKAHVDHQQELVSVERVVLPPPGLDHRQRKGISLDGGMVNVRDEGWKEMKVGAIFDVEQRLERDPITGELVEQAHGVQVAYTAVLGSVEQFAPALWVEAVSQQVPQAADSSVTADGAQWIWNLAADRFAFLIAFRLSIGIMPVSIWPVPPPLCTLTTRRLLNAGTSRSGMPCSRAVSTSSPNR